MWKPADRVELATARARAAEMVLVKGPVAVVLAQEPATGLVRDREMARVEEPEVAGARLLALPQERDTQPVRDQEMALVTELAMVPVEGPEVALALEQVSALDRDQGLEGRFGPAAAPVTEPGQERDPGVQP